MSVYKNFTDELYYARKKMGLTQEQVAEAVDISVRWYQYVESGERDPGVRLAIRLIAYLEIDGKCLNESRMKKR